MSGEIIFVFGLLLVTVFFFASGYLRLDVVAILVIITLMLSGILSPTEALAGFGDSVVLLIAGLFVVGESLVKTGVAHAIGEKLMSSSKSDTRLLISLMLVVAGLSAFMSSTGAVAIFIPIALNLGKKAGISPSQLLMPIAIASLLGGMLTLIGTPPNLVVSNQLVKDGFEPFGFFDFAPIGIVVLIVAIAYLLLIGRKWLPKGNSKDEGSGNHVSLQDLLDLYSIYGKLKRLQIKKGSPLLGKILSQTELISNHALITLGIERKQLHKSVFSIFTKDLTLKVSDIIYIISETKIEELILKENGFKELDVKEEHRKITANEFGLVEVLVSPNSEYIGQTLNDFNLKKQFGVTVLGLLRKGKNVDEDFNDTKIQFGDSILMIGEWEIIGLLQNRQKDFLVLNIPKEIEDVVPNRSKAPLALGILLLMMISMTFSLLPAVTAVLMAAISLVLTKCVNMKEAYKSINWESIVLIAGMLPMATALEKTGGAELIANGLADGLGSIGPMALLGGLFLLTSLFSQFISNTATTVLIAPIAVDAAIELGLSPYPILMTVAIAASTAFATPVASPVNTLVMGPGDYRFAHFVKVGIPLQIIVLILTMILVPLIFPF